MQKSLLQLLGDFFSTIVFVIAFAVTNDIVLATSIAIGLALAQFVVLLVRKKPITMMQWMSLGLVIVLGGATMLTQDSRFIRMKASIVHFAIGAVMLKPGWQRDYLPPVVIDNLSKNTLTAWGFAWAGLMFAMGIANFFAANLLTVTEWGYFIAALGFGKLAFFFVQYFAMRGTIVRSVKAKMAAGAPAP